jgi:hypothetical protein
MKQAIPWTSLTAVFKDAIRVCKEVGIAFLWIDSLCIVQDSVPDWEIESSKMCDYYGNAHLAISAGSSPDGTVSFLSDRAAAWVPRALEITDTARGVSWPIFARRALMRDSDKLGTRAWVWQEQVLSSRLVHFSSSCVIWACRGGQVAQDGWDGTRHLTSHFAWDLTCDSWDRTTTADPYSAWC